MYDYTAEYKEIPVENRKKVSMMQNFVEDYFNSHPNRKPRNIHRTGINIDRNDEKARVVIGHNNYLELSSIYCYLLSNSYGSTDSNSTFLEYMLHLNDRGSSFNDYCSEDQHMAEMALVSWLGSNVGMEFVKKFLNEAGYEVVRKKG